MPSAVLPPPRGIYRCIGEDPIPISVCHALPLLAVVCVGGRSVCFAVACVVCSCFRVLRVGRQKVSPPKAFTFCASWIVFSFLCLLKLEVQRLGGGSTFSLFTKQVFLLFSFGWVVVSPGRSTVALC